MVPKPHLASIVAPDEVVAASRIVGEAELAPDRNKWRARHDLDRYRAETERLRVLADFLARPIHAHGGCDPDPDIVTAYNLAVEAALQGIRRAACPD
jgi:hypothetical protein